MRRFHIFLAATAVVVFLTLLLAFPYCLIGMEAEDLFLFTGLFFSEVLERSQGVAILIQDFLCQFFSTPWIGAAIYTLVISAAAWFVYKAMPADKRGKYYWAALIPGLSVAAFSFPLLNHSLNFLFFAILLRVYTGIKGNIWRCVYAFLITIPAFCLMTWYEAAFLTIIFGITELSQRRKTIAAFMLIPLAASLAMPTVWSVCVSFVPLAQRPFSGFENTFTIGILSAYLLTAVIQALPAKLKMPKIIGIVASPLAVAGFVAILTTNKDVVFAEKTGKLSYMADQKDWEGIIAELPYEEAVNNRIYSLYVLLAMSATESLPHVLFSYPLNSPEQLMFRHDTRSFYANFNRQFYDNIGIWNEAFHYAFEYGVTQRENECFKALRFKADYAIKSSDTKEAERYLDLLSRSCNNGKFVKERRKLLEKKISESPKPLPYRSDTFTGAYPMASEMFRLFDRNRDNRKLLDYVLCSLLLNKEVEKFGIILSTFNLYKGELLPKPYAEAVAVLASRDTSARGIGLYDHNLDRHYLDFENKAKRKMDTSEYFDTYWNYLYFRPLGTNSDYSGKN